MKRLGGNLFLGVWICLLVLTLTGCPGLSDWEYNDLPGNYSIIKVNSQDIQFGKRYAGSYSMLIDRYVVKFCNDSQYVGLQRIPINTPYDERFDIAELQDVKPEYYLIDSATDTIYGPWSENEYYDYVEQHNILKNCQWVSTDVRS